MRLAHGLQRMPVHSEYAIEIKGELDFVTVRRSQKALVDDDWYTRVRQFPAFWSGCEYLLTSAISGKKSEMTVRIVDGLTWFGEAAFESAPGTQIVKFIAALERLTTTQHFNTHVFCTRVALLVHTGEADFESCYRDAATVYDARCRVMHGEVSPRSKLFSEHLSLAHELARKVLFKCIDIHRGLDNNGAGRLIDLHQFFQDLEAKNAHMISEVRKRSAGNGRNRGKRRE